MQESVSELLAPKEASFQYQLTTVSIDGALH